MSVLRTRDGRQLLLWFLGLLTAWVLVWFLHEWLKANAMPSLSDRATDTAFWGLAKVVVWLLPMVWLTRGMLELTHLRGLFRGLVVTAVWLAGCAVFSPRAPRLDAGVLNASLLAPLIEEIAFRGYAWGQLRKIGFGVAASSAISSVAFGVMHLPGWFFMGRGVAECASAFAFVTAMGALFALVRSQSPTLWSPILFHAANNAWNEGAISWLLAAFESN